MAYIEKYGLKFHWDFILLLPSFGAITLFGHVFTNKTKAALIEYLNLPSGKKMANHERIHTIQADSFKTGYIGFYTYYLTYWVKNLFVYGPNMDAYYNIPFEREAYQNEQDYNYSETHWKDYRG